MHHKYHTFAIVLDTKNSGESDKLITFFTRDLGVIFVKAQGIRKKESKLRYAIQPGSYAKIDIVKGKDIWRLTSAIHIPLTENIFLDSSNAKLYMRILRLVYRLYRSENKEEDLFDDIVKTIQILATGLYQGMDRDFFEISTVMMILGHLGYWDDENIVMPKPYELELTDELLGNRNILISKINKALRDTQL